MLDELINKRNLPLLFPAGTTQNSFENMRNDILTKLQTEIYGTMPPSNVKTSVIMSPDEENLPIGNGIVKNMQCVCSLDNQDFSFPFKAILPKHFTGRIPAFVYISFSNEIQFKYHPFDEIIENGFAIFTFCHNDITQDNNDFNDKCAKYLSGDRENDPHAPGKIAMWAWAAMRVMDYVTSLEYVDTDNIAVCGHSRLGKTALLTGAFDKRFKYVISNDSGCIGAALSRGKIGETNAKICTTFPYWFCPQFVNKSLNDELPNIDQHFILAMIPPRHLLVCSAEEDLWADPISEFLCIYKTNEVYKLYGKQGLICPDELPIAPADFSQGDAHYHVRHGVHYHTKEDWLACINYIRSKM